MMRFFCSVVLLASLCVAGLAGSVFAEDALPTAALAEGSSSDYYQALITEISGDWEGYGELFTMLQSQWFWKIFLGIIVVVPLVFLLHYLIIGAKHFDHDGPQIYFFPLFTRVVHFLAALTVTLLVITGLLIIFGSWLGGGTLIRLARYVHLISAIVFVIPGILMTIMWIKDMLPTFYDLKWMMIVGGYLSKEKKPVPAGKFNAGQKMYFWFASVGGLAMAYTGYVIWAMNPPLATVQLMTIIHNVLGMGIVAFYLTHVYMSVFAIAGSLNSIKTGYKPKHEVDILHSRYRYD
jgi:formate dehydrogenase subunit gamma